MQHIYLLRHGKVAADAALYGATDVAVMPEVNQAIVNNIRQQKLIFNRIYSSPLQRCKTLAQGISRQCGERKNAPSSDEVIVKKDLQEMNFGEFDGVLFDHIYQDKAQWHLLEKFWQAPSQYPLPQAEPLLMFYQRVAKAWQCICQTLTNENIPNSQHLVVCHGGVIRMILATLFNDDIEQAHWYKKYTIGYGSLTHITVEQGLATVVSIAQPCLLTSSKDRVL